MGLPQHTPVNHMEFFIYLGCLGFGLLFTILSAVLGHLFGGVDHHVDVGTHGHVDAGFDNTGMPGVSIFSPVVICSFITAFGAFGLVFSRIEQTRTVWLSAPLAAACGLVVAGGAFAMFNAIFERTQASSETRIASLVGKTATVITPIPANGVGEIAYVTGGTRCTAPAREQSGLPVANGQTVKVTRIAESQFFVSII
jgi:membrane protein implicated in regulation of membrane protease activity